MSTPVGWVERAAAAFTNTRFISDCQLPIADLIRTRWHREIGNENAPHYLALLSEVPCRESAGPGVLHPLRHALDDRSRTYVLAFRSWTSQDLNIRASS